MIKRKITYREKRRQFENKIREQRIKEKNLKKIRRKKCKEIEKFISLGDDFFKGFKHEFFKIRDKIIDKIKELKLSTEDIETFIEEINNINEESKERLDLDNEIENLKHNVILLLKLSLGRLIKAYDSYLKANNQAILYTIDELTFISKEKLGITQIIILKRLEEKVDINLNVIKRLFQNKRYGEIRPITQKLKSYLNKFERFNINDLLKRFQNKMFDFWEEAYPIMVDVAESYFDEKQFDLAKEFYGRCKGIVKELQLGPNTSSLLGAFMRYETICEVQIIIAQMFELVTKTYRLLDSHAVEEMEEAKSLLSRAQALESEIPVQFRDKKKLDILHIKMNNIRENLFK